MICGKFLPAGFRLAQGRVCGLAMSARNADRALRLHVEMTLPMVIAHPPPGSIETMFIKGLGIQAGSEPILPILERSAWGSIRGRMLK